MDDLIRRLEAATEGSHELDCEVYRWWRQNTPPPALGAIWTTDEEYTPHYTTSLDAALSLVPEGMSVKLFIHPDEYSCYADVYRLEHHQLVGDPYEAEHINTPAIALVIASLRARQT